MQLLHLQGDSEVKRPLPSGGGSNEFWWPPIRPLCLHTLEHVITIIKMNRLWQGATICCFSNKRVWWMCDSPESVPWEKLSYWNLPVHIVGTCTVAKWHQTTGINQPCQQTWITVISGVLLHSHAGQTEMVRNARSVYGSLGTRQRKMLVKRIHPCECSFISKLQSKVVFTKWQQKESEKMISRWQCDYENVCVPVPNVIFFCWSWFLTICKAQLVSSLKSCSLINKNPTTAHNSAGI